MPKLIPLQRYSFSLKKWSGKVTVSQYSIHLNWFFETTVFEIGKMENVYVDSYCLIVHVPLRYPILKDRARGKYGGVGVLGMISACSIFNLVSPSWRSMLRSLHTV